MKTMSFPPQSVLRLIKKVSLKVETEGAPPLFDEIAKQFISAVVHAPGSGLERVLSSDASADAIVKCNISCVTSTNNSRDPDRAYVYGVQLSLMAPVPSHLENELFVVWNGLSYGFVPHGSLYGALVEQVKVLSAKLVNALR